MIPCSAEVREPLSPLVGCSGVGIGRVAIWLAPGNFQEVAFVAIVRIGQGTKLCEIGELTFVKWFGPNSPALDSRAILGSCWVGNPNRRSKSVRGKELRQWGRVSCPDNVGRVFMLSLCLVFIGWARMPAFGITRSERDLEAARRIFREMIW